MHLALLVIVCLLMALGFGLLVRGLRPVRRGDTPHCPTCEYNLTGLVSDKCPECGETVAPERIVRGECHRRPFAFVSGLVLLVSSAAFVGPVARRVDWVRWSPTFLLIRQVEASQSYAAWTELERRICDDMLTAGHHSRLVEAALKEQDAKTPGNLNAQLLDYLGRCLLASRLSAEQENRFLDQVVQLTLSVRPRIVLGDSVPYRIDGQMRGPTAGLSFELSGVGDVAVDRQAERSRARPMKLEGNAGLVYSDALDRCPGAGRHMLTIHPEIAVYARLPGGAKAAVPLRTRQVAPLEATFEVLAAEPPGYIKRVNDAVITEQLRQAVTLRGWCFARSASGVLRTLEGIAQIKAAPVNVACELIARIDGADCHRQSIVLHRGNSEEARVWLMAPGRVGFPVGSRLDIVLRSDDKIARSTLDLYEIWDGELVFESVPYSVDAPVSRPAAR